MSRLLNTIINNVPLVVPENKQKPVERRKAFQWDHSENSEFFEKKTKKEKPRINLSHLSHNSFEKFKFINTIFSSWNNLLFPISINKIMAVNENDCN